MSWPVATHAARAHPVSGLQTWRGAAEVLDWSLLGESLWTRTRPLAFATWRRIVIGLERYGGPEVQPFVQILRKMTNLDGHGEKPRRVISAFVLPPLGIHSRDGKANAPRPIDDPLQTIIAQRGGWHLIQPYIVRTNFDCEKSQKRMGAAPRSTAEPMQTILASNSALSLAEPFLVPVVGRRASHSEVPIPASDPFPSFQTRVGIWLADAVIIPRHGERPGQQPRAHTVTEPMPTIPASGAGLLARGFLLKYYGNDRTGADNVQSVDDPLPSPTTKDRCMLVRPVVIDGKLLDIRLRMIQPHELSAGMGFPSAYSFAGNRTEIVKQIGNAVEVNIARALCSSLLAPKAGALDQYAEAAG